MEDLGLISSSFWANKNVFLTGHTGFKGAWLAHWLQLLGANVTGYALSPPTQPNLFELLNLKSIMTSHLNDIRNVNELKYAIDSAKPDIIFHLAAQSLVRQGYQNPVDTYGTNVMGTVNLLEVFRQSDSAQVCINVTTDKCYENKEWHYAYRENDRLGGYDPYSNSKACAELVSSAYRQSFLKNKALATVRAGNVIGGGDWSTDRLLPDIIMALSRNEKPIIRYPAAIRPWQHVLEPLSGYLTLAEKCWHEPERYAGAWNFGPHIADCQSVAQITNKICHVWGQGATWVKSDDSHPHEATFLKLDISKTCSLLSWSPRWHLDKTIKETVTWYQYWLEKKDIYSLSTAQIADYCSHKKLSANNLLMENTINE